jgi:CheY-like chemotaxis protein
LRENPRLRDIPVIAMSSADLTHGEIHQCKSQAFLQKPFEVQRVRAYLEYYGLRPQDV